MSIQIDTWVVELREKVATLERQVRDLEARLVREVKTDVERVTLRTRRGKKA